MRPLWILFVLFISTRPSSVVAQESAIQTDRPSMTDAATTVDARHILFETAISNTSVKASTTARPILRVATLPSISLRYGLLNRLEIRAGGAFQIDYDESPFESGADSYFSGSLGLRYHILSWDKIQLAITSDFLYDANWHFSPRVSFAYQISDNWTFSSTFFNYFSLRRRIPGPDNSSGITANIGYQINPQWSVYAEYFYTKISEYQGSIGTIYSHYHSGDFGAIYLLNPSHQLDFYFQYTSFIKSYYEFMPSLGYSFRI